VIGRQDILYSFLIPSIPARVRSQLAPLLDRLCAQAEPYPEVEILAWTDNMRRSIGEKRDDLVQLARGKYLSISDDDDDVSDDFIQSIVETIWERPDADVIVFDQSVTLNGEPFRVSFGIEYENEPAHRGPDGQWEDVRRKPFHCCVWRSELAKMERFPAIQYGEDWAWCEKVLQHVKVQARIPKVLHRYSWNEFETEAF